MQWCQNGIQSYGEFYIQLFLEDIPIHPSKTDNWTQMVLKWWTGNLTQIGSVLQDQCCLSVVPLTDLLIYVYQLVYKFM